MTQTLTLERRAVVACVAVFALYTLPRSAAAEQQPISESALRQVQALLAEKASRTVAQRKIDSNLLFELRKVRGDAIVAALPDLRSTIEIDRDGVSLVDVRAEVTASLLVEIESLGGTLVSAFPRFGALRARLPIDRLEELAALPEVRFVGPAERMMLHKINTSEGEVAHAADLARSTLGVDGSGVKIGVISDSVDALAALQASGDLPATVTVLPGQSGIPGTSEGTAMLEIVFDLAPAAELFFATAKGGQASLANNILDLQAAGCDVIVDDVFYFAEPTFQDGIVAQAVDTVAATGVQYFSSAGNSGNLNDGTSGVWEGDYVGTLPPALLSGSYATAHDFGGGSNFNTITVDSPSLFTLQWSDAQGGSATDYDLLLLNPTNTIVIAASTNLQNGTQDPFEAINSADPFDDTGNNLVVAIASPSAPSRFVHLNSHRGQLTFVTAGQTSGHSAAVSAFSVAAVDVATAGGTTFTGGPANPVETFSSDGPRRIFYDPAGNPLTPGDLSATGGALRQKPDVTAADGVATATPGFNPFFGTSAAAPHAAAIAGLMQENGNLTPAGMRQIFAATALDIEAAGTDRDSGLGIVDALAAVGTTNPSAPTCYVAELELTGTPNDGPQTFRACNSITWGPGTFNDVTGEAPQHIFADGFESGDTSAWGQ